IVASTTRPLSHLTRNIAFGSASCTTPSNSSLSPFGSFRSRRSLMKSIGSLRYLASFTSTSSLESGDDALRHLVDAADTVDSFQDSAFLVEGQKLRRHSLVRVEPLE